jgi:inorganic triphosphatase YgiF
MGVETEVKLAATPEMLARLLADPRLAGAEHSEHLVSTYFDTPDSRLHRAGACLRVREKRHGNDPQAATTREQTLKLASPKQGAIHRQEWNIAISGNTLEPANWPEAPRATLAELLAGGVPLPLGATHVHRVCRRIRHGATIIDIMADSGEIRPATPTLARHHPLIHRAISELELELVEGDPADLFALAASLPLGPGLIWLVAGKGARCRAIARDVPFRAVAASIPPLSAEMDISLGFHAIGWSCLGHLLGNYPLVLATGDPDAVHQSRVAIRRLRAAFSLFGKAVADAETAALRAGFKAAASALAPARDRHVLLKNLTVGEPEPTAATAALLAHLAAARDAATAEAQAYLVSAPFQCLLVNFALWLERGAWREYDTASPSLPAAVSALLDRRQRKLRRLAKAADTQDDEQLHALRIEIKKLRYAISFFAPLFAGEKVRRQQRAQEKLLGGLQEVLGNLHDIANAATEQAPLFAALKPADAGLLAAELARHTAALALQRPHLLRRAAKLLSQNADTPHWWAA